MMEKVKALEILKMGAAEFSKLEMVKLPETLTYSKNVFIPVTNACANSCSYCGFRSDKPYLLTKERVEEILKKAKKLGCREALFTLGERADEIEEIGHRLKKMGYSSMVEYVFELCEIALEIGLLPHTNMGTLRKEELEMLREVNASMGAMLENSSSRMLNRGMPHENSPGKDPDLRLELLRNAGRLKIPFTTGILVGIGEKPEEIVKSLQDIEEVNRKYGNIQEVIIQNFKPKRGTKMESWREPGIFTMLKTFRAAREIMSSPLQVPPNLNPGVYPVFVLFGAQDFGGVSPLTKDYINPEAPWPKLEELKRVSQELGIPLRERLPIYPEFIKKGWFSERVGEVISQLADEEGFANGGGNP